MTDSTEQQKPAINTKQPKSTIDTKTLAEVANRVDLVSVRLVKVAAELKSTSEASRPLSLNFSYKTSWVRDDPRPGFNLLFEISASLEHPAANSTPASKLFDGELRFLLEYSLPEVFPGDWSDKISLFTKVNGPVNAWPYARAELQSLFSKMELPAVVLPVHRPGRPDHGSIVFTPSEDKTQDKSTLKASEPSKGQ